MHETDQELGKRDDDFSPPKHRSTVAWAMASLSRLWRWRKKRFAGLLMVMLLFWWLLLDDPVDLPPDDQQLDMRLLQYAQNTADTPAFEMTRGPAPSLEMKDEIMFPELGPTLRAIAHTKGSDSWNHNVVFGASSLRSFANLIPLACNMAQRRQNHVHFVIFGRDPLPVEDILEVNGVKNDECIVNVHDARPHFSKFSSDERAEALVTAALLHVNYFLHPQVVIVDDANVEDSFFTTAAWAASQDLGWSLLEVPDGRYTDFLWITGLSAASLAQWSRPSIDIFVHVPPGSFGGLARLVQSLTRADYRGFRVPNLIIDLPFDIQAPAKSFLGRLSWPPGQRESPNSASQLRLRHRLMSSTMSPEQASVALLESFYPTSEHNHVLILSTQVELSPLFMHYLHYNILKYRYSNASSSNTVDLAGIALDVPVTSLDSKTEFKAPLAKDMPSHEYMDKSRQDSSSSVPFVHEAPSTTATLIFGEKWMTMHNFLAERLAVVHAGKAERTPKIVSEASPAWAEYLLELMRVRGWGILRPASSLVTVHNELARIPEEFQRHVTKDSKIVKEGQQPADHDPAFLPAASSAELSFHPEADMQSLPHALHELLPFSAELVKLSSLPYVLYNGKIINPASRSDYAQEYKPSFRQKFGACSPGPESESLRRAASPDGVEDLFCLNGMQGIMEVADVPMDESKRPQETLDSTRAGFDTPVVTP